MSVKCRYSMVARCQVRIFWWSLEKFRCKSAVSSVHYCIKAVSYYVGDVWKFKKSSGQFPIKGFSWVAGCISTYNFHISIPQVWMSRNESSLAIGVCRYNLTREIFVDQNENSSLASDCIGSQDGVHWFFIRWKSGDVRCISWKMAMSVFGLLRWRRILSLLMEDLRPLTFHEVIFMKVLLGSGLAQEVCKLKGSPSYGQLRRETYIEWVS